MHKEPETIYNQINLNLLIGFYKLNSSDSAKTKSNECKNHLLYYFNNPCPHRLLNDTYKPQRPRRIRTAQKYLC